MGTGDAAVAAVQQTRRVAAWLFVCCALVFAMVVVGGVTRLTHSGLSIVEWQPIVGTLPPLSEAAVAGDVREVPADARVPAGQPGHDARRVQGHLLVGVFPSPARAPDRRRRSSCRCSGSSRGATIPPGYAWKLAGIFVLGGLQGAMGWYMVKSGLVDDPRVSQFRLTAHLGLALVIFAAMFWVGALARASAARDAGARRRSGRRAAWAIGVAALVFVMALSGGFVAGIRAGFAYNTFPLMNGHLVPPEIFMIEPWWRNFFYNMATVQFDHRALAWLLAVLVPVLWWKLRTTDGLPSRARVGRPSAARARSRCRSRWESRRCSWSCRSRWRRRIRRARCWSSPRRSTSRTRCGRRAATARAAARRKSGSRFALA